ncbi:MAG: SPOR domain-containing protein, partial [Firmicutes bacterium]|nr:SPOR domain-containing protein [Bacillota bacterium]
TVIEDKVDTVATTAYAVQLGSFSTEEAAKQRVNELKEQGISAKVQLRDNAWKVVSEGFHTKEEAREAAAQWRNVIGDAFVVAI